MSAKRNIVLFPFLAQNSGPNEPLPRPRPSTRRPPPRSHPHPRHHLRQPPPPLPPLPPDLFPSLHLADIPFRPSDHGLPPDADTTFALPAHLITPFNHATYSLQPHFHRLLSDLSTAGVGRAAPPLLYVIADMFLPWTVPIAQSLGIFHAVLYASGPFAMSIYNYIWSHLPHAASDVDDFAIPDLPDIAIRRSQLSRNMLSAASPDHPSTVFVRRQADLCHRSGATLWNIIDALEKLFLDAWARSSGLPVFAVGPLFAATPKPPAGRGVKATMKVREGGRPGHGREGGGAPDMRGRWGELPDMGGRGGLFFSVLMGGRGAAMQKGGEAVVLEGGGWPAPCGTVEGGGWPGPCGTVEGGGWPGPCGRVEGGRRRAGRWRAAC